MEIENLNLQKQIDNIWEKIYPIGSIYISTVATSPHFLFGGLWVLWGQGKVPVGVDTSDSDFNSVERIGGEKRHTLTLDEMPKHAHPSRAVGETHTQFINDSYDHTSSLCLASNSAGNNKGWSDFSTDLENVDNDFVGGSQPHNNLQPYITCYMWKRVGEGYNLEYYDNESIFHTEHYSTIDDLETAIQENQNIKTCTLYSYKMETTSINGLFGRSSVESLNLDNFDMSNVTSMNMTFTSCENLKSIYFGNYNTEKLTSTLYTFLNCTSLEYLDISGLSFNNVTSNTQMFKGIPADCQILVKDQTAKNFVLSARSDLTNVQIKS